jgi:hypothetical protein
VRIKIAISTAFTVLLMFLVSAGVAGGTNSGKDKDKDRDAPTPASATVHTIQEDDLRLEGQRKFHSNCGRCHAAPPKFSPRMSATIVRHMRVRATITEAEAHLILQYLAQ